MKLKYSEKLETDKERERERMRARGKEPQLDLNRHYKSANKPNATSTNIKWKTDDGVRM